MEIYIGIAASIVVDFVKKFLKLSTLNTYLLLAGISLAVGASYVYFKDAGYLETVLQIITVSAAFHNLVIRRLDEALETPPAN